MGFYLFVSLRVDEDSVSHGIFRFFFGLTWLFVVFYEVTSFSRTRSLTRKLRMGYCGKLKERLVLLINFFIALVRL
jgi:hypothetical protein